MSGQISAICKSVNFHIRNLWRIRKFITREACHHAVRAWSCHASIMPSLCFTEPSILISNGFSAFKTKQRAWCLRAVGTRVRHTFYVPFTGCQSRTESSTRSCCMFRNLLITRLRSTSLTFSNCTMLPTALNTIDVDYAPLLMPLDLPYLVRSVKLGTIRFTCAVLGFGIGFR